MDKLTLEDFKIEALGDKQLWVDTSIYRGQAIIGWHLHLTMVTGEVLVNPNCHAQSAI